VSEACQTTGPRRREIAALSLAALGVVYGDIGTSPLYAIKECFAPHHGLSPTPDNLLGILSLVLWALLVVIVLIAGLILGLWWLQRMRRQRLGETLSAVAEHARKETERRLLGSRKSPAEPQGKA